ncbi:hypothetical protein [Xanthobacter tagetidis]|uniref:Uncharacterized protein n=1 Tax=Xanthobacter tagetidis TaxID=60216 RepID=A0A3L7AIM5_9HYPH|nr:hypothetical protein [Xanthobacter tagetidis]MBB6306252.1 hypothetical protein [Xanthobacter tagetidis]RLP79528.1 hypothetical protein D9R14_07650 [Xanthobacter tagetidis]
MSQKSWEPEVSALAEEMKDGLRQVAGPGGSVKERIVRAARRTGFSYWRTFDLWYGKARRIDGHEVEAVRSKQEQEEALRAETDELLAEVLERVAVLEAAIAERDAQEASGPRPVEVGQVGLVGRVLGRPSGPLIRGR